MGFLFSSEKREDLTITYTGCTHVKKLSAYISPLTTQQRVKYSVDSSAFPQTFLRIALLLHYLWYCLRYGVVPWRYFQLNGVYFNEHKGIYSKLDIDALIPEQHHLPQSLFSQDVIPKAYPVFLKPEWGQNSNGISRIDNKNQYLNFVAASDALKIPYIIQDAALGKKEFEIYYLRSPDDRDRYAFLSITEVINRSGENYPVNSIYNSSTGYTEVTEYLTGKEIEKIWNAVKDIGGFRMARIGVKADDLSLLVKRVFKIIEINLFLPMPMILLAENVSRTKKIIVIRKTMTLAAQLVKTIPHTEKGRWIFFKKMRAHYKTAL